MPESSACAELIRRVRAALGPYDLDTPDQLLNLLGEMRRHKVADQARRQQAGRRDGDLATTLPSRHPAVPPPETIPIPRHRPRVGSILLQPRFFLPAPRNGKELRQILVRSARGLR